jgi:hypothetical protein
VDNFLDFLRGRIPTSRLVLILFLLIAAIKTYYGFMTTRYELLKTVFNRLIGVSQLSSPSLVSADAIRDNFRGDDHPLVVFGTYSTAEALKHMLTFFELVKVGRDREEKKEGFNSTGGSTVRAVTGGGVGVGLEKFVDYYADLSATVDDDEYFTGMVSSNWAPLFEQE